MELPLISNSPATAPDALIRAIKRADAILARTGTDEQQHDAASVYVSADRAGIAAVNRALDVRVPDGSSVEAAIDDVEACFEGTGATCLIMDTNEKAWPAGLGDALTKRSFNVQTCTVHSLAGYAAPDLDETLQIIPARAAYGESRQLFAQQASTNNLTADQVEAFADTCIDFLDEPRVDCFLARRDRQSVGHVSLLTLGNIGVMLDLFTLETEPPSTAEALLSRLVDYCLRAQFEQVITRTVETDVNKTFLEERGFKPRAQYDRYVK